jgi:hypothetical protein
MAALTIWISFSILYVSRTFVGRSIITRMATRLLRFNRTLNCASGKRLPYLKCRLVIKITYQWLYLVAHRNAREYNPDGDVVFEAANRLVGIFHDAVNEFKQKQIQVAKKSFARASAKPNSAVAALVESNSRLKLKNSLVTSSGTLIVVPSVLLEHWQVGLSFLAQQNHIFDIQHSSLFYLLKRTSFDCTSIYHIAPARYPSYLNTPETRSLAFGWRKF